MTASVPRTLVDGVLEAGDDLEVDWDGRNERGSGVASGVYFYQLDAPGHRPVAQAGGSPVGP